MNDQYWSWLLTAVGVTGFILAGKKIWWAWYINIACQLLWFYYALATDQYGFIVAAVVYTVVFMRNAISWTNEHKMKKHKAPLLDSSSLRADKITTGEIRAYLLTRSPDRQPACKCPGSPYHKQTCPLNKNNRKE